VGDLAGGRKYLVLGPGKNGGYHRAGRVGVSTGGRLRWGRINISAVQLLDTVQPIWTGCTASSNCTAFSSYLGVFELFVVECCADVHFFVVIRTGVSGSVCVVVARVRAWFVCFFGFCEIIIKVSLRTGPAACMPPPIKKEMCVAGKKEGQACRQSVVPAARLGTVVG
jgi:hypothetical protein